MIYILSLIFVGGALLVFAPFSRRIIATVFTPPYIEYKDVPPAVTIVSYLVFVVFVATLTLGASIKQVPAGHVGLVYTFGDITGQRDAGLQIIAPWQGFKTTSIQTQKIRPETTCGNAAIEECLEAFSEETQNVFIRPTINLSVSPTAVQELFTAVGPDYIDKLVRPRLHQIFKDETVKYVSVEIAPSREGIRKAVRTRLIEELAGFSITVEDLLIDNISFNPAFEDAIEAKQNASQEALKEAELVEAARQRALQKVEEATGEANANTILAQSLREQGNFILQFRAIEALADNVRIILLPEDSGLIPILGESLLGGGVAEEER